MSKNDNKNRSNEKLELAKEIAKQQKKLVNTFDSITGSVVRVGRWLGSWADKILFNQKYSKLVAIGLAVLLYVVVYYGDVRIDSQIRPSLKLENNIKVNVNVDTDVYEVEGLPSYVSATIFGEAADIQAVKNQSNYNALVDLTGKTEGQHQVALTPVNFSSKVSVEFNPSTVVVTIRKKVSSKFVLTHDFVNTNKMDQMYSLGTPEFANNEILVQASQQTVDSIAYVKALIDVTNVNADFETEAPIYAYNSKGEKVNVDLMPSIVKVKVPVTSPNKTVPIIINPIGLIPNNMAISEINLDHSAVTLYGSESVLSGISHVTLNIDATKLTGDLDFTQALEFPSGVRKSSISKVNMKFKLGARVSKDIVDVPIMVENNINGYKFTFAEGESSKITVRIYGTEANIKDITNENIGLVYIDMQYVQLGEQELPIYIEGNNRLVTYELDRTVIKANVIEGD